MASNTYDIHFALQLDMAKRNIENVDKLPEEKTKKIINETLPNVFNLNTMGEDISLIEKKLFSLTHQLSAIITVKDNVRDISKSEINESVIQVEKSIRNTEQSIKDSLEKQTELGREKIALLRERATFFINPSVDNLSEIEKKLLEKEKKLSTNIKELEGVLEKTNNDLISKIFPEVSRLSSQISSELKESKNPEVTEQFVAMSSSQFINKS